jgi:hypothetical protein
MGPAPSKGVRPEWGCNQTALHNTQGLARDPTYRAVRAHGLHQQIHPWPLPLGSCSHV